MPWDTCAVNRDTECHQGLKLLPVFVLLFRCQANVHLYSVALIYICVNWIGKHNFVFIAAFYEMNTEMINSFRK